MSGVYFLEHYFSVRIILAFGVGNVSKERERDEYSPLLNFLSFKFLLVQAAPYRLL